MAADSSWQTNIFNCFEDLHSCCYGFWCCPCLACTVAGDFGENRFLPLCDICTPSVMSAFGIPLCVPPVGLGLRIAIRHKYGIKDSIFMDIVKSCFCVWCNWCQMHREMKYRKHTTPVINIQPTRHTSSHPASRPPPDLPSRHQAPPPSRPPVPPSSYPPPPVLPIPPAYTPSNTPNAPAVPPPTYKY